MSEGEVREVLDTLAAIKVQVTSVLQQIHEVQGGALEKMSSGGGEVPVEGGDGPEAPALSRDEVKAQREAKKAAKAARKNKSLATQDKPEEAAAGPQKAPEKAKEKVEVPKPKQETAKASPKPPQPKPQQQQQKPKDQGKQDQQKPQQATPKAGEAKPQNQAKKEDKTKTGPEAESSPEKKPATKVLKRKESFDTLVEKLHPKFKELGLKYSTYTIRGSNQRTIALLDTVKNFVLSYRVPEGKGFKQDISSQLQLYFDKLALYRPFAVGMTTAVEGISAAIRHLEEGLSDSQYKEELEAWCEQFVEEKINKAVEAIAEKGAEKIKKGETILAFSLTDAIFETFKMAADSGTKFELILVLTKDTDYLREYQRLRDTKGEIGISYINLSSIMSFISSVDKVFLGGHALFTTGGVMAHAGSSTIALAASHHNVPVLFFCETYKFCDKSPTDAFYSDVFPENKFGLGRNGEADPLDGMSEGGGEEFVALARFCYDVTPVNLVTCVITDIDMLPTSSVPVVLRVQESRPLTKCV